MKILNQKLKEDYNWIVERISKCSICGKTHKMKWLLRFGIKIALWGGNSKEWVLAQFLKH